MATSTVEDYLKQIYLEEQRSPGALVSTGHIAAALKVTPGSATSMMKTLAESGLVRYEPYGGVNLTPPGTKLATLVLRRHRLVELFLVKVMGMDWTEVHPEAEHLEHVLSDRLLERMDEMLGHPSVDPHGDPIPNADLVVPVLSLETLVSCPVGQPLTVARVEDQSPDFLRLLERRGLTLGARFTVTSRDELGDTVDLELESGRSVSLGLAAAGKIWVEGAGG